MTKHEYETELKAMQEKRHDHGETFAWAWAAKGGYLDSKTFHDTRDRFLNEAYPLPVWVEPQPVVKGPSGVSYELEQAGAYVRIRSMYPTRGPVIEATLTKPDLHAVVLALRGPQGVADFVERIRRISQWDNLPFDARERALAIYPMLVALAAKG